MLKSGNVSPGRSSDIGLATRSMSIEMGRFFASPSRLLRMPSGRVAYLLEVADARLGIVHGGRIFAHRTTSHAHPLRLTQSSRDPLDETVASFNHEPSGLGGTRPPVLLLRISCRLERHSAPGFRGGDEPAARAAPGPVGSSVLLEYEPVVVQELALEADLVGAYAGGEREPEI